MGNRVAVAMSGGIDSSVAAALLQQQGYDVEGVTMRLLPSWLGGFPDGAASDAESPDNESFDGEIPDHETPDDRVVAKAAAVCERLGIEHHVVDLTNVFEQEVLRLFAQAYTQGLTPNPCIVCNQHIKFGYLYDWMRENDFDYLATGHYAKTDGVHLMRPADKRKDQTYFMYRIAREHLAHVLFPLADLNKEEVRHIGQDLGFRIAADEESQDACFDARKGRALMGRKWFLEAFMPGDIVTEAGEIVGTHEGVAHFTVGQRRGLGVGGLDKPHYVTRIDAQSNQVIIGQYDESATSTLVCKDALVDEQIRGLESPSASDSWHCHVMARYNMTPLPARCRQKGDRLTIDLQDSIAGIAPGQSAVCYQGDIVVAGGIIACKD